MKYVITGGTGLIGRHLTRKLTTEGHRVAVTSRHPERVRDLPEGAAAEAWDGQDPARIAAVIDGADGVVHLLGAGIADRRWTDERKREILSSRVDSTRALAEAFGRLQRPPTVLVQGSATGYYGDRDEPVDETAAPGEGFLSDTCQTWEAAASPVRAQGVRLAIARTGVVLSRHGGALPRMLPPFRLGVGGRLGDGKQGFSWIHEDDEVAALAFLLTQDDARGAYNLTAPELTDNAGFTRALGRALRRPTVFPVPAVAVKLLFGEMSSVLLDGVRARPARLLAAGFEFRFPGVDQALGDLLQ